MYVLSIIKSLLYILSTVCVYSVHWAIQLNFECILHIIIHDVSAHFIKRCILARLHRIPTIILKSSHRVETGPFLKVGA